MLGLKKVVWYLRSEWNWKFIIYYRNKLKLFLVEGAPKTNTEEYEVILKLNDKALKFCNKVSLLTHQYLNFQKEILPK